MNYIELYLLNRANKVKASIGTPTAGGSPFPEMEGEVAATSPTIIPMIFSQYDRSTSGQLSWTSNNNFSQAYTTNMDSVGDMNLSFWFALGDASPNTTGNSSYFQRFAGKFNNGESNKTRLLYGTRQWIGHFGNHYSYGGNTTYSPFCSSVMFIRNPTGADITKTFKFSHTTGSQASYSATAICSIVPNNTSKTSTNSTTATRNYLHTSNSYSQTGTCSITFPANKTTAVVFVASAINWTSFSSGQHWVLGQYIQNLNEIFDSSGLVPDLKMTTVAYQGRNNSWTEQSPYMVWTECGAVYGDD